MRHDGQRRVERLGSRAGDDHHVAITLHPRGNGPFHHGRVEHIDIVVHHHHVLQVHHRQRGHEGILALAGLLLDGNDGVPETTAAEGDVDVLELHAGNLDCLADGLITRGCCQPGVLPRHVQRVVGRVLAHQDGLDAHVRIPVQAAHQPGEFTEAAFGLGPAGGHDLGFEHDFGIGDIGQVDGLARCQIDGRTTQSAGDGQLVHAHRGAIASAHDLHRMGADRYRDRAGAALLIGALCEQSHVVGGEDVDAGEVAFLHHQAIDAGIGAQLRVARDHHTGSDHRTAIENR